MSFQSLSVLNRGVILIFCSLILFCYFYLFLKLLTLARRAVSMLFPGLMLFLCFELFQLLVKIQEGDFVPDFEIPIWLILPGLVLLAIYAFLLLGYIRRWQKQHISAMSVKEAIDRLPTGLLICSEGGIPIMLNETMQHICRDRFGKSVMDGTAFYENLRVSSRIKEVDEDDTLLIAGSTNVTVEQTKTGVQIKSLAGKNGTVKLALTFPGGAKKNVTVRVKRAK
ncbi:MAG: hypothetical protein K5696_09370 [Lachnospiraceae bacterium]|nr:hypothetical protein [Lachnospiraceae bacterium]